MSRPNQRRAPRSHVIKAAEIMLGVPPLQCTVLDVSAVGVRVYLSEISEVPERVNLRLPDGSIRGARRVWQQGAEAGFEFVDAAARS